MELTVTLDCNEDVAHRLASLAELQAERIKANEGKGGWRNLAAPQLLDQLRGHVSELKQAVIDLTFLGRLSWSWKPSRPSQRRAPM